MKKRGKIFILTLVIIILFSGVVYAAQNGMFEGFRIVNVVVNGKKVEGDVPAINFHGRTMVPIRFVGEELGAEIEWDDKTWTAHISSDSSNKYSKKDIEKLKFYNWISYHYSGLEAMGNDLNHINNYMNVATYQILENRLYDFSNALDYLNGMIEEYNEGIEPIFDIVREASEQGIDISDMGIVMDKYGEAIDHYKLAFDSLIAYSEKELLSDFDDYLYYRGLATDIIYEQIDLVRDKFHSYNSMIQNY